MTSFQQCLATATSVTVLAGAGLSAASGIPTFRGAGGLWRQYNAMSLATPEAFKENPSRSWSFYEYRRRVAVAARPNAAHLALARLAVPEHRKASAPACGNVALITQNVDGLSRRAAAALEGSSPASPLLEMHGSVLEPYCTNCGRTERFSEDTPIVQSLANIVSDVNEKLDEVNIPEEDLPRCQSCKGLMRPGVVWFGEVPRHLDEIDKILRKTDLLLVVGTSCVVYPAAGFASRVKRSGGKVAVFNIESSEGDDDADFVFLGPCEETLPRELNI